MCTWRHNTVAENTEIISLSWQCWFLWLLYSISLPFMAVKCFIGGGHLLLLLVLGIKHSVSRVYVGLRNASLCCLQWVQWLCSVPTVQMSPHATVTTRRTTASQIRLVLAPVPWELPAADPTVCRWVKVGNVTLPIHSSTQGSYDRTPVWWTLYYCASLAVLADER